MFIYIYGLTTSAPNLLVVSHNLELLDYLKSIATARITTSCDRSMSELVPIYLAAIHRLPLGAMVHAGYGLETCLMVPDTYSDPIKSLAQVELMDRKVLYDSDILTEVFGDVMGQAVGASMYGEDALLMLKCTLDVDCSTISSVELRAPLVPLGTPHTAKYYLADSVKIDTNQGPIYINPYDLFMVDKEVCLVLVVYASFNHTHTDIGHKITLKRIGLIVCNESFNDIKGIYITS